MRCPNTKHKKPFDLKTERTHANGRTVTRVRYCSKCKTRFETVEFFKADYVEELRTARAEIDKAQNEAHDLNDQMDSLRKMHKALAQFAQGEAMDIYVS